MLVLHKSAGNPTRLAENFCPHHGLAGKSSRSAMCHECMTQAACRTSRAPDRVPVAPGMRLSQSRLAVLWHRCFPSTVVLHKSTRNTTPFIKSFFARVADWRVRVDGLETFEDNRSTN